MKNDVVVFIPSKGRANRKLYEKIEALGLKCFTVVEPQEYGVYSKRGGELIQLPENDQGIAYARNVIIEHALKNDITWSVVMDDDITSFGKSLYNEKGLRNKRDNNYLLEFIEKAKNFPGHIISPNYAQYSWSNKTKDYSINSTCAEVVVMYRVMDVENIRYDMNVSYKEDRDFAIQCIKSGVKVLRLNRYFFQNANFGGTQGGQKPGYDKGYDERDAKRMQKKWGKKIISLKKNSLGKLDIKVNWQAI